MQILVGVLILGLIAAAGTLSAAFYDDKFARRLAAILLARASAREAYRERYQTALGELERDFGL